MLTLFDFQTQKGTMRMTIYWIHDRLTEAATADFQRSDNKYAAVLTPEEWEQNSARFDMGIEMDIRWESDATKAEVNYDSLTGSISIPDRENISGERKAFAFAMDEKGIVFIDRSGYAAAALESIRCTRKWRYPSLERFLYDFLEYVIAPDPSLLHRYEARLEALEDSILRGEMEGVIETVKEIRGDLIDLKTHYEQLADFTQELEENENCFFNPDNLRYFRLITARIDRFNVYVQSMRDYCMQLRDLYQTQIDVKQNRIMTVLTVISTIFFPLTVITGWYGMNFQFMPELSWRGSYPVLAGICLVGIITGIVVLKKKKWL